MAIINLNEYTSGDFITIKEYPSLIYNNETITFANFDIQCFKIWITSDNEDVFGPCESGCHFKTGTGKFYGTGRHCKIIVADLRDKPFSHNIGSIARQYFVEDGITQTVSFNINTEISYRLNAIMDNSGRFSAIEDLIDDTNKGNRINTREIEKLIIDYLEKLFPDYINKKVDEYCGINSFSQLSSLITNIKNECLQLKKVLSEKLTKEISQMFSCISVEVRKLDIIIPEETVIEQEANRLANTIRTIKITQLKEGGNLIIKALNMQLKLVEETNKQTGEIIKALVSNGGEAEAARTIINENRNNYAQMVDSINNTIRTTSELLKLGTSTNDPNNLGDDK